MNAALPGAMANVFVVRMAASLGAVLVMLIYCVLMIDDAQRRMVSMILLLAIPLIEPFHVISTYWLSRNHNRPNIVARSSALMVRAGIIAVGLYYGAPVWVLAAAWVIEAGLNASMQSVQLASAMPRKRFGRFVRRSRARVYLGFGLRFVLSLWLQALFVRLDRLLLGERMEATAFGLYATAMQLTEVWTQVAYLIGVSLATAYLYQRIRQGRFVRAFVGTLAAMVAIGLAGLAGAWWFGPTVLRWVFGPQFEPSYPFLVAGMAFAVLLFGNQILLLTLTTLNRPRLLVLMWGVAVLVAVPVIWFGYETVGAYAGPLGLSLGLVAGWLSLLPWHPMRAAPATATENRSP
jgi:O-antigen/teichoic acid export membrane protein